MSHIVQTWLLHYHKLPSWYPYFVSLIAENAQNFHFYGLLAHTFFSQSSLYSKATKVASVKILIHNKLLGVWSTFCPKNENHDFVLIIHKIQCVNRRQLPFFGQD